MAELTGNTGSVTIGATGLKMTVTEWSGTLDIDAVAIPAAFGEKWESSELTVGRFTGSLRGKITYNVASSKPFDASGADWSVFKGSATLTAATGCTIAGTLIYNQVSITHTRNGYAEITANFRNSTTDVAVTWDETP